MPSTTQAPPSPDNLTSLPRPAVLVIDDAPQVAATIRERIGKDYEVIVATSGEDAVTLAMTRSPDLIVMETQLPGVDGFELCEQLRSDPQTEDIPIIFLTAHGEGNNEVRGLELGAIDFILKPIRPNVLGLRIHNHLALKKTRDFLHSQSMQDRLTGIGNRRCFEETFGKEWHRAMRQGTPLSLVLLDVDHFRAYNQTYGRQQGDECLRQLARFLRGTLQRWADTGARYGSDRFIAILPQTADEGAAQVAERLRDGVIGLALPSGASSVVSVSIGVATCVPTGEQDPISLLRLADDHLYDAKTAGRNQVR